MLRSRYKQAATFLNNNAAVLLNGDSLKVMRNMGDESVDLIFADPPYFLSGGGITCASGKVSCVNKGVWDKPISLQKLHAFNRRWLKECRRLLKPEGTIFISGTSHNIYSIGFALQQLGFKIINDIAWFKVNPPPNLSCRCFTHSTETILWAKKSGQAKHVFNYETMREMGDPTPGRQMLSLWHITPPKATEKRYGKHPTQKPEALLNRVILAASREGGVVLDPFCGSGTAGVCAVRNNRKFIGIDLSAEYLHIAHKRIEDACAH
ncbi:MAG TPA: site-specific DNA-methyltransferase [Rickettsiales bacterium]|nr:site-specific DNA-methyltransferase [Rickettsiales bacterium]